MLSLKLVAAVLHSPFSILNRIGASKILISQSYTVITPHQVQVRTLVTVSQLARIPKGKLRTMKLSKEIMAKVLTPELEILANIFKKYGFEIRMAGGPVRDLLMDKIPSDIDLATTATPDEMKAMFEKEQIRMINAKGEQHGTITARINEKQNFEVTTLRIDVVTDGRHAQVEFTKNWQLDAGRRDLTVNSMFLDLDGLVYDYFDGFNDVKNNIVRFVGDPNQRIQEDYLRILRYFRFYGRLVKTTDDHNLATIQSIQNNGEGLKKISGERIWMEFKKIADGNFGVDLIIKMLSVGIGKYIGLPDNPNIDELVRVNDRIVKHSVKSHPITLITALLRTEAEGLEFHKRLKLSAFERDLIQFLILHRGEVTDNDSLRKYQRILVLSKSRQGDVRGWIEELLKYQGCVKLLKCYQEWNPPKFPVSGHTLIDNKVPAGRAMNEVILQMKEIWIESNFTATSEDLIAQLPQILEECGR